MTMCLTVPLYVGIVSVFATDMEIYYILFMNIYSALVAISRSIGTR